MYWDLNVPVNSVSIEYQPNYLLELARLGYGGIALNVECDLKQSPPSKDQLNEWVIKPSKKLKPQTQALRLRENAKPVDGAGIRQLRRITIRCEEMNTIQSINSHKITQDYDIVAVEALSARVFQFLCETADIDIITFDMSSRLPFQLRKPWIDAAIRRNIHFEIQYTSALGGSNGRRCFFSNVSELIRITKGRNILFTSGSTREIFLRAPYDIINLSLLPGLRYEQAKESMSGVAAAVVAHGEFRRTKGAEVGVLDTDIDMES